MRFNAWRGGFFSFFFFIGVRRYYTTGVCIGALLALASPSSWALLDGVVSGARASKDFVHQRVVENHLFQLIVAAKKNYDASVRIYKEMKRLNEGKGIVKNVASDLGAKAKAMAQDEKSTMAGEFAYRHDSGLDRLLWNMDEKTRNFVAVKGMAAFGFMDNVNQKSAEYAGAIKTQAALLAARAGRGKLGREEGVKIAAGAKTATDQALGLGLQGNSDAVEALNQLVLFELARQADDKNARVNREKALAEIVSFFEDSNGLSRQMRASLEATRLLNAPAAFLETRRSVTSLALAFLGLVLTAGLIWEFAQTGMFRLPPPVLGLPLALVLFGFAAYQELMASFAIIINAAEETITPLGQVVAAFGERPVQKGLASVLVKSMVAWHLGSAKDIFSFGVEGLGGFLSGGFALCSVVVLQLFFWVRYAFFALLYVMGPLMIALSLYEPLRRLTFGWLLSTLEVGLWGIGMKILMAITTFSSVETLLDPAKGSVGVVAGVLIVNLIFLAFSVCSPFFIHSILSGGISQMKPVGAIAGAALSPAAAAAGLAGSPVRQIYKNADNWIRRGFKK